MHKTVEAITRRDGQIRLLVPLNLSHPARALVTVLEDVNTARLSEAALAKDWEREEEDKA